MESPLPGIQLRYRRGQISGPNILEDRRWFPVWVSFRATEFYLARLTMFPVSVEPRANMKNTSLQAPFFSSSEVALCRASRRLTSRIGLLRAGVAVIE